MGVRELLAGGSLVASIAYPTLSGGGFDDVTRATFVALAGLALLVSTWQTSSSVARAVVSPLSLTLIALAGLSLISVLWTVGSPAKSFTWGLTIAGYAAVLVSASAHARRYGPSTIVWAIAILGVVEAVIGLRAVALHELPHAERIVRVWRPGGTFEYPPALAILQVGVLSILCAGMGHARKRVAGPAAAAALLVGATLALSGSRLAIGMAAALLVALVALRSGPGQRGRGLAMATIAIAGGAIGEVFLGGEVGPRAPGGAGGLVVVLVAAVMAGAGWALVRGRWTATRRSAPVTALCLILIVASAVPYSVASAVTRPSVEINAQGSPSSDLFHGRIAGWRAAFDTWLDRPVIGAGADQYYGASFKHQPFPPQRFAHNLPLELAAELGLLGGLLGLAIFVSGGLVLWAGRTDVMVTLVGPLVAAFLVSNLLDWTWHLAGLSAIWAAAAGGMIAASQTDHRLPDVGAP
jgi:hypothetical protein